jgi:hypothetical protein
MSKKSLNPRRDLPKKLVGRQGLALDPQSRELVKNVKRYFEMEKQNKGPILEVGKVVERTALALNLSLSTVKRITNEDSEPGGWIEEIPPEEPTDKESEKLLETINIVENVKKQPSHCSYTVSSVLLSPNPEV